MVPAPNERIAPPFKEAKLPEKVLFRMMIVPAPELVVKAPPELPVVFPDRVQSSSRIVLQACTLKRTAPLALVVDWFPLNVERLMVTSPAMPPWKIAPEPSQILPENVLLVIVTPPVDWMPSAP